MTTTFYMNPRDQTTQPNEDWRKLLLTEEEQAARIRENYHIDPETGEILGEKITLCLGASSKYVEQMIWGTL